jgi:hypothetical protein
VEVESFSDDTEGEEENDILMAMGMQQVDFRFSENERLREEMESAKMYAEDVRTRAEMKIETLTADFEAAKSKLQEEHSIMVSKLERDLLHLKEDMMKERKAFLRNLKLRDEQDKMKTQMKDDLQLMVEELRKANDKLKSDAERIVS